MISKKQRFMTILLVILLVAAIVGGVFGISYFKYGVTFPWQVDLTKQETENVESAEEIKEEQPKELKVKVVEKEPEEKVEKPEPVKEEIKEEPEPEDTTDSEETEESSALSINKLSYYGPLHVEDTALCNSEGEPVRLTGVSSHNVSWYPDFVSADTIASLRETWGINTVRLAIYTSDYDGYCVGGKENQDKIKELVSSAVDAATDNEMYVILDWHILNDSNPNEYKSEAIQFFGEMVRKYKDNENVIYEICNEPNGDTTWDDIRDYANEIIPVIRNVDEDAIILVGTPEWSSDLESPLDNPLNFDNIMYTYHFYAGSHKVSQRNALSDAIDAGLPVFISEYGLVKADGDGSVNKAEAKKWFDKFNEYNLSSCMWNLSNKDEGSALIKADCDKTSDWSEEDLTDQALALLEYITDENTTKTDREQ